MPSPGLLQVLAGPLEVKFKAGTFSTWSDSFVRLEGRWLCVYKRERDSARQGAVELGLGVSVTDVSNPEASAKFPRRFDVTCSGGVLPKTEVNFRTKSRKDRDLWVQAITSNLQCLTSPRGLDPRFGVRELAPVATRMKRDLMLHPIRIRSDLTVRCATGEAIVTFLVSQGLVSDRVSGAAFCRQLVSMNLLHHVVWDRDFTDSPEPFVIVALDNELDSLITTEDDYHVAHFLKYMDSRKFWRYIASPDTVDGSSQTTAGNVSTGSRRAVDRSTSSSDSGRGIGLVPGSDDESSRFSMLSSSHSHSNILPVKADNPGEKKARKCAVCTKSFNPLRRRHHCRQCRAVICSSCSVIRRSNGEAAGEEVAASSRVCISCKLSSNETFISDVDDLTSGIAQLQTSDSQTSTTSDGMDNSRTRSNDILPSQEAPDASCCTHCQDENCAPLTEFAQISYPAERTKVDGFVKAKVLDNETERLQTVDNLLVTMAATPSATRVLRQFCNMAAIASQCSVAVVGLLDRDNYVMGAQYGVSLGAAVARKKSLAAHTCRNGTALVCANMTRDVRFQGNSWRQESLKNAAFYAGIPLVLSNGHAIGALEVFDDRPRFECGEVIGQLQTVLRGLLNLFEDIMTAAAAQAAEKQAQEEVANKQKKVEETPAVNPMEAQLLRLLSQTTTTQEQLRTQQGQMVSAISSHSKQIDNLAKQLERIEATLAAKLGAE
ncbi:hypothetical protein PF005_g3172 [Phytophthora fragariae]|uniref:FYVE-type domain-containing protein n=1 Tax=Phytophthora fragariae TaxID=53985 RepID=A0A6A3FQ95_9STRA|nr:hypothetical protein PF003_g25870 [Phytophthora fragariae]KAE8947183.1 hypothetical protein PF009_g3185 [Phytophthora fragariae]KAE9026431.1 hypothetical protein PF011_g2548 [Phytophthora fragariae]KAE9133440.1 hypothetical protein PF010_g2809 [Phytophthora fragariae]KAE9134026.1 hypothetical protein PF007_g3090 [Phytophthora fragariae]